MEQLFAWAKAFIGWFGSPYKTMITCWILSGLALFLPAALQSQIGVCDWTHSHLVIEWGMFLFCSVYLLLNGIEIVGQKAIRIRRLKNLSSDEKEILRNYVSEDISTCSFQPGDIGIHTLVQAGILEQAKDSHEFFEKKGMGFFYYSISPKVLKYLKKHWKLIRDTTPNIKKI